MGFEQLAALKLQLAEQAKKEQRAKPASAERPTKASHANGPNKKGPGAQGAPAKPSAKKGSVARHASTPAADIDPVVVTISRLQRKFPKAFPKKPAAKVPLKLGVHEELQAQSEALGLSKEDITLAIKTWCQGSRYWACLVIDAARVDLSGEAVGVVTEVEAKRARQLAHRQRTGGAAKRKKPADKAEGTADAVKADGQADAVKADAVAAEGDAKADTGATQVDNVQAEEMKADVVANDSAKADIVADDSAKAESDAATDAKVDLDTPPASPSSDDASKAS